MAECIINNFEDSTIPEIDKAIEENFFGEEYPSPESSPSYVSTYIDNDEGLSLNDVIKKLGNKMIQIGNDFVSYVNSFESLRFEIEPENVNNSQYKSITGYNLKTDKYLLVGDRNGSKEVIGALPFENDKYIQTKALLTSIKNRVSQNLSIAVNKSKLQNLINSAYSTRTKRANPLSLSKYSTSATTQTINELKKKYGDTYPHIFSSPYIVTGKFNSTEDYSGRTIILYNKFPTKSETVDEIIEKYGYSRALQDRVLGIIPLNNSSYENLYDLIQDIEENTKGKIDYNSNMFASSPSLNQFGEILQGIRNSEGERSDLFYKITDLFNKSSVGSVDGFMKFQTYALSPLNFVKYLNDIKTSNPNFLNTLNQIYTSKIGSNLDDKQFKGLFINPIMIKKSMDIKSGLARINSNYLDLLDSKLKIVGLSPNVVQPQRMEFKITDNEKDLSELFNLDYKNEIVNVSDTGRFNYSSKTKKMIGSEIHPSTSNLLKKFESKGIYHPDINQWVKSITSEVLLNSDSTNFTKSFEEILRSRVENNQDCI